MESIGNSFQILSTDYHSTNVGGNIGYILNGKMENLISFNNTINGKSSIFFSSFDGFFLFKYPIIYMWVEMWVIWMYQRILLSKISPLLQIKSQPKKELEEMLDSYILLKQLDPLFKLILFLVDTLNSSITEESMGGK